MSKIYSYKLVVDDGGAPCVTDDLLTLAICKPAIRSTAQIGDIIFGFGSNELHNRLIYVAEVTGKHLHGEYYDMPEYRDREDSIYIRSKDGSLIWRRGTQFHHNGSGKDRDIGNAKNNYKRANVLLSRKFAYFGDQNNRQYIQTHPELAKMIRALTQGHRVHCYAAQVEADLKTLKKSILGGLAGKMKFGNPSEGRSNRLHNEECGGCSTSGGNVRCW